MNAKLKKNCLGAICKLVIHYIYPGQKKNVSQKRHLTFPRLSLGLDFPVLLVDMVLGERLESIGAPTKHALIC